MKRKTRRAARKPVKRRAAKKPGARKSGTRKRALSAVVIRHVAFEDLGNFAPVLRRRGLRIRYVEAGHADLGNLDALAPDLLVVLGGPIEAYDDGAYPFLADEVRLLQARLRRKRPVLGVCLGAQLLARALGARVYPGPAKEIGWAPIELTKAGMRSPLKHLAADRTSVLHWHGDTFELPAGAVHLASTAVCTHQAFALGKHALGLQFHPEAPGNIESWLIGHTHEIAATPGVTVEDLRAQTVRCAPALQTQGPAFLEAWLDGAGLRAHIKRKSRN